MVSRKTGILLCCLSAGVFAIIIGMASIAQQVDMLKGDFYTSLFAYIHWIQWVFVIIIFCVGVFFFVIGKKEPN